MHARLPTVSDRVLSTDDPVIVKTKRLMASRPGVLSLAQGIVHWQPPPEALSAAAEAVLRDPAMSSYGPCDGMPALQAALVRKIEERNGLLNHRVMITAGANQAFINAVVALVDERDAVVLYAPIYFNHRMAIQMCGGADRIEYGPCQPCSMHPDLQWLEQRLAAPQGPPKLVVITNPCNPTGVLMAPSEVQRAADLCAAAGTWLLLDNTYEDFVYGNRKHYCASGPNVIHIFSFSKAYGMMGWRVGYLAFSDHDGGNALGEQLLKVQDTIPICPTQLSQLVALVALEQGQDYVQQKVQGLTSNRDAVLDALSPLGTLGDGIAGGEGAIYLWARLPEGARDDDAVVAWLVKEHGVCVIPGSSCEAPGYVRLAYANLEPAVCQQACARLRAGLDQLVRDPGVVARALQPVAVAAGVPAAPLNGSSVTA